MSLALALAGERAIKDKMQAHVSAISTRGYGTHYGDHSGYQPKPGQSLTKSSCVVWAMECAEAAFNGAGQGVIWQGIARTTRAAQLRGTVLVDALVRTAGWTGIYWNPDTRNPADRQDEHPYSYGVARRQSTYYRIPVRDFVVNYSPTAGGSTALDLSGHKKLEQVPFWIGCARGGRHVFCGTRGLVSEFHWNAGPSNPKAIENVPLRGYGWLSGIICVPPGTWR